MYISHYIFYKIRYDLETGEGCYTDVKAKEFGSPQEENSLTREMRKQGYLTKMVPSDIYRLICSSVEVI